MTKEYQRGRRELAPANPPPLILITASGTRQMRFAPELRPYRSSNRSVGPQALGPNTNQKGDGLNEKQSPREAQNQTTPEEIGRAHV